MRDGIMVYKQQNNTMNSHIMVSWIRNFLAPSFPADQLKLLILDSFSGHKTNEVKEELRKHNFHLLLIPSGCTKYLQPLDISVNRSFKSKLKQYYVKSLEALEGSKNKVIGNQLRKDILIVNIKRATKAILPDCVRNGFREYST